MTVIGKGLFILCVLNVTLVHFVLQKDHKEHNESRST